VEIARGFFSVVQAAELARAFFRALFLVLLRLSSSLLWESPRFIVSLLPPPFAVFELFDLGLSSSRKLSVQRLGLRSSDSFSSRRRGQFPA